MPQVILELTAEERKLLQAYKQAVSADAELRSSVEATGESGKKAGKKIADGMIAGAKEAAEGMKRELSGGITDKAKSEMRELASILRTMGPEGKKAADALSRHLKTAGREGVDSIDDIIDRIGQIDNKAAESARNAKAEFAKLDKAQEKTAGPNGLAMVAKYGSAWFGVAQGIDKIAQAMALVRETNERALESLEGNKDGDKRLLQVSRDANDFQQLRNRADELSTKYGIDRDSARSLMFSARSEGFESAAGFIASNQQVLDVEDQATVAGQIPGLFVNETLSPEQAINMTLAGAEASRLDFGQIARALPGAAEGGAIAGASSEETIATLSVLAGRFKSGDSAADRIKALATKIGMTGSLKGLGIIGGVEKLAAMKPEDRGEILKDSQELNAAYTIMVEELATIKERRELISGARSATGTGASATAIKRGAAQADPKLAAILDKQRAENVRQINEENRRGLTEAERVTARDLALADAERRGASPLVMAGAEMLESGLTSVGATGLASDVIPNIVGTDLDAFEGTLDAMLDGSNNKFYPVRGQDRANMKALHTASAKLIRERSLDPNAILSKSDVASYLSTSTGSQVSAASITDAQQLALTKSVIEGADAYSNDSYRFGSGRRNFNVDLSNSIAAGLADLASKIETQNELISRQTRASERTADNTGKGVDPAAALKAAADAGFKQ